MILLYLTGFNEPDAILVLIPGRQQGEVVIFCRPKNRNAELWSGERMGVDKAIEKLASNQVFSIDDFNIKIKELLTDKKGIYYPFGDENSIYNTVIENFIDLKKQQRQGITIPDKIMDIDSIIHEMRIIKNESEISIMQQACDVSVEAHKIAMKMCFPGKFEYNLESCLQQEFMRHGIRNTAYNSIVASGHRACILHYTENNKKIDSGDLVLIDAGCEIEGYAADLTRTFPANGKFNPQQKQIYNLVLKAQLAAIKQIEPGIPWNYPQQTIIEILTEGLVELGILKGHKDDLIKQQAYKEFYMHGHGHLLGLDVHDVGAVKINNKWRELKSGMVLTIEPGLYMRHDEPDIDKKWKGIGVRIEDNILVTKDGCQVLSKNLPKTIEEIEQFMRP